MSEVKEVTKQLSAVEKEQLRDIAKAYKDAECYRSN